MRRLYNITILLSVFAIGFIACNKDKENKMTPNTENEVYWSEEDVKIQNAILDFQDKIKNNSFKDGEMMSVEDALWNLEALINYNYSTPDSGFLNLTIDTTFEANVMINNGMVSYNNLVDIAFGMEEYVVNFTNQLPSDIGFMIAADVTLKENSLKDGTSIVAVTAAYGSEKRPNTPCYSPFEDYDYWRWGGAWSENGGYCDGPYVGDSDNLDAAEKIQFKINNPECLQQDIPGSYVVQTTSIFIEADYFPNPDDDVQNDNSYDCLMYYQSTANGPVNTCLSPDKMDWYVQGTAKVVQDRSLYIKSLYPDEIWKFLSIDIEGDYLLDGGATIYLHNAYLFYGKLAIYVPPVD
ncbi:hypothetical protein [Lentimicrobium sp. S6]|uniref:hypothetical protein n=1 Tax=Lentimicrobium sp. S6 TaxID=2735872 RepID=UPI0015575F93|nr:hypothetical protein [Lentimicrobium sp. S6]NPD47884.1 hypothetical protein [Lentimicrobium sp. S6]